MRGQWEGDRIWRVCVLNWLWRWVSGVKRCVVGDIPYCEHTDWVIGWLDLTIIAPVERERGMGKHQWHCSQKNGVICEALFRKFHLGLKLLTTFESMMPFKFLLVVATEHYYGHYYLHYLYPSGRIIQHLRKNLKMCVNNTHLYSYK